MSKQTFTQQQAAMTPEAGQPGQAPQPKKKKFKWWYILIIVAVLGIIGKAASNSDGGNKPAEGGGQAVSQDEKKDAAEKKTEPSDTELRINVPGEYKGLVLTILDFKEFESENDLYKPDKGNKFYYLEVEYQNNSKKEVSMNALDWKIKTPNGELLANDFEASLALDDKMKLKSLAPGGKSTGKIPFQLPAEAGSFEACYYSNAFSSSPELTFKLK